MTKTTNYQLNQWAKSDRVLMDDFNADNQKIDAALGEKIGAVFGIYTGDGTATQTVSLGFTPKLLYTCSQGGIAGYNSGSTYCYGGLAAPGHPVRREGSVPAVEIIDGGFRVTQSNDYNRVNLANVVYHYAAFR